MKNNKGVIGCGIGIIVFCIFMIVFFSISYVKNSPKHADYLDEIMVETDGKILPENEGKLVLVSGTPYIANDGIVVDEEYGIELRRALSYERNPRQLVYELKKETTVDEGDPNDIYDDKTTTRYYIGTTWITATAERDKVVEYGGKKKENPRPAKLESYYAGNPLMIGEFEVKASDFAKTVKTETIFFSKEQLERDCKEWMESNRIYDFTVEETTAGNGFITTGNDIGDIRIWIDYNVVTDSKPSTIIGKQVGNAIEAYGEGLDEEYHVLQGIVTKEEYISELKKTDAGDRKACVVVIVIFSLILAVMLVAPIVLERQDKKKRKGGF